MAFLYPVPNTSSSHSIQQFQSRFTHESRNSNNAFKGAPLRCHRATLISRQKTICKYGEEEPEIEEVDDFSELELSEGEQAFANEFEEGLPLLNTIILTGRLGGDPEMRIIGNDVKLCKFSLAVANEWDPDGGPDQEKTSWFNVEAWGSTASYIQKAAKKGMRVGLSGSFNVNAWEGKDGMLREDPIVTATSFEVLQSRTEPGMESSSSYQGSMRNQGQSLRGSTTNSDTSLEDLPF